MRASPDKGVSAAAAAAKKRAKAGAAAPTKMPTRLHEWLVRLRSTWPGRILISSAEDFGRLQVFDRSMTIAAQFFTSVFPILILLATRAQSQESKWLSDAVDLPNETRSVLEDALAGADTATFSVVGLLFLLASATSLSRALIRAFAAIWDVPRPRTNLGSAWRWLAAVLVLAIAVVLVRTLTDSLDGLPPRAVWPVTLSLIFDLAIAVFVPWVLLAGTVAVRRLAPGAAVFALLMLTVRPASAAWLPGALESSADRYGSIGVAFTYLAALYAASLCFLATAMVGHVIATDSGRLGAWIRRGETDEPIDDETDEPIDDEPDEP